MQIESNGWVVGKAYFSNSYSNSIKEFNKILLIDGNSYGGEVPIFSHPVLIMTKKLQFRRETREKKMKVKNPQVEVEIVETFLVPTCPTCLREEQVETETEA